MTSCIRFSGVVISVLLCAAGSPRAMIANKRCLVKPRTMTRLKSVANSIADLFSANFAEHRIRCAFSAKQPFVTIMIMHTVCVAGINKGAVVFDLA